MWLTLDELAKIGLSPTRYKRTSKILKVMVAEDSDFQGEIYIFSDLKTGNPVLYFENCETDRRTLVEVCCNLKEVDQSMNIGIITVEELLEILKIRLDTR